MYLRAVLGCAQAPSTLLPFHAPTCAQQIRSLTRTERGVTSVKQTLALIASRSAAVFDQFKYWFVLRYKYVKHPFVFVRDANKSLHKCIHEFGRGGSGGGFITHQSPPF